MVSRVGRNENILILMTPLKNSDFLFSVGHKRSYNSAYDSNSESVASENQFLQMRTLLHLGINVKIGH